MSKISSICSYYRKVNPKPLTRLGSFVNFLKNRQLDKIAFFSEHDETSKSARSGNKRKPVGIDKIKGNIWQYSVGKHHSTKDDYAFEHPAIFPESLAKDHILSWSNEGDVVFDPFMGSGTTGKMAVLLNRRFVGIEQVESYFEIANKRISTAIMEGLI